MAKSFEEARAKSNAQVCKLDVAGDIIEKLDELYAIYDAPDYALNEGLEIYKQTALIFIGQVKDAVIGLL